MLDFNAKYKEYLQFFEKSLNNKLTTLDKTAPKVIKDAMSYSVEGGGKRVRPILCYAACEMLGGDITAVEELALAIEFIHSYSLVHDDLPDLPGVDIPEELLQGGPVHVGAGEPSVRIYPEDGPAHRGGIVPEPFRLFPDGITGAGLLCRTNADV